MIDTIVGDGWRWAIVVLGFLASAVMWGILRLRVKAAKRRKAQGLKPDPNVRGEVPALIGAGCVCLFIATGTLGVILDLDSVFRLPFMATALAYSVVGRGLQLAHMWKAQR